MEKKKTIILDLTDCKYLGELHERIRVAFGFPEWYGANWDAFWDLLWSECDADEVIVQGTKTLPTKIGVQTLIMFEVLDKKVSEREKYRRLYNDINSFSYKIES